jgi:CubicO group peptidase (beta-lactamase class C family)
MATTHEEARVEKDARARPVRLRAWVDGVLNRHPAVGLAVGIIRHGSLEFFDGRGFADIASNTPIDADTVFRIGSVTKPFTAIAVMQLHEQGLVDLDAPANDYLRGYRLVPARAGFRPATVRHLLTHTAGVAEVQRVRDLLHPEAGPFEGRPPILSVAAGEPMPSLAEYYRRGLRVVAEPGTRFAYCNHGFATLGQIVEDVSGMALPRYFRERVFEPLGMADTDLVRSGRVASRLATGYAFGRHGVTAVPDRDWIGAAGGGIYSTVGDIARLAAALIGGGANEHGSILQPATLATMFEPHFQPDPRVPGWGLGFARGEAGGHRLVGHDGILPGFNSTLLGLRTTAWPSWRSRTGRGGRSGGWRPSSRRCCATCSAYPTRSSAPTFRSIPRCGASCAAATERRRGSRTCASGWPSPAGSRCSFVVGA